VLYACRLLGSIEIANHANAMPFRQNPLCPVYADGANRPQLASGTYGVHGRRCTSPTERNVEYLLAGLSDDWLPFAG